MLNRPNTYFSSFDPIVFRRSLLDRRRNDGKGQAHQLDVFESVDEVVPSETTRRGMRDFVTALMDRSGAEHTSGLNDVAAAWRADNAAGGVPVHAHRPLPSAFAKILAQFANDAPHHTDLENAVAKLDPSVRTLVGQQLAELLRQPAPANDPRSPLNDHDDERETNLTEPTTKLWGNRKGLLGEDDLGAGWADLHLEPGGGRAVRGSVPEDRWRPFVGELSWSDDPNAKSTNQSPQYGPPWPGDSSEGGEGGPGKMSSAQPRAKPSPNGPPPNPTPKPPAPPPRVPQPGHRPGEWERHPDPRTENGSRLVSHRSLSERQQRNLLNRNWIHPTGEYPGHDRLMRGWGYFGAERSGQSGVHYHGGYDAPGTDVVLPTRAKFVGYDPATQIFTFDLGDGLILQIVHVNPTAQMQRMRPGTELDAGWPLGRVDGQQDHAHIQIRATGSGGDKWVVDPTPYMEKRARTFLRRPTNDTLDWLIDIFATEGIP